MSSIKPSSPSRGVGAALPRSPGKDIERDPGSHPTINKYLKIDSNGNVGLAQDEKRISPQIPPNKDEDDDYVYFRPYHWEYEKGAVTEHDSFAIRSWAMGKEKKTDSDATPFMLRVETFPAFCVVELPSVIGNNIFRWDVFSAQMFVDALRRSLPEENAPLPFNPAHFGLYKKLYYYSGNTKYAMVTLVFKTVTAMEKTAMRLKTIFQVPELGGGIKAEVWETEIDPIRKLLTKCSPDLVADPDMKMELGYCSWLKCKGRRVTGGDAISTVGHEYILDWTSLKKVPEEECASWKVHLGALAFDIECYSNRKQTFPDKNNTSHVAYMISAIYQKLGLKDRYRYAIILGDCKEIPEDKFKNTTLFKVNTEEELVRMFGAITLYHDPEILTGYNILGFDYPYLDARLGHTFSGWPQMSRIKGYKCYLESNTWQSGAYGHMDINMLKCPGRISVDMLNVIRRDHRMSSYSLNSVANKFVNKSKHDITAAQMFEYYESMLDGISAKDKWMEKMKDKGLNIPQTDDPYAAYYEPDDIPVNIYSKLDEELVQYDKGLNDITRVMIYCIQDSELVLDIMSAISWDLGSFEMASIVGVNMLDLSTRGQQVRCLSQLYHLAALSGIVLTLREAPDIPFEGGAVQPPTPGLHTSVITIDFTSLYPSIMRAFNICYTTLIPEHLSKRIPDSMCEVTPPINCNYETDQDASDDEDEEEHSEKYKSKGKKGTRCFRYIKKEIQHGLVPRIEERLCNERNRVKGLIAQECEKPGGGDPMTLVVLDKRQNGLKISANSFFGFLGVREGGKRPLIEGAMSITAWGRQMITKVIDYLKTTYDADIIYGDTDSAMISMPKQIKNPIDAWYWGERIAREVTALFPPPINMEFEKVFATMLSLKKKKYLGLLSAKPDKKYGSFWLRDDGQVMIGQKTSWELFNEIGTEIIRTKAGKPDPFIRGVLVARRDNCKWSRDIYTDIMMKVLLDSKDHKSSLDTFKETVDVLCGYVNPLVEGKIPADELYISRALGANYKSNTYFMKVFADEIAKEGKPARAGDRLEYLVMKRPQETILGKRMMLKETYNERYGTEKQEPIDYAYYLEKGIQNHIDQLISISFKDVIDKLKWIGYRQNNRQNYTDLHEIVKMMVRATQSGVPIKNLQDSINMSINYLKQQESPFLIVDESQPVVKSIPGFVIVD